MCLLKDPFHCRTSRTWGSARKRWETPTSRPTPGSSTSPSSRCAACSAWPPGRSSTSGNISSPRNWSSKKSDPWRPKTHREKKMAATILWNKRNSFVQLRHHPFELVLCWKSFFVVFWLLDVASCCWVKERGSKKGKKETCLCFKRSLFLTLNTVSLIWTTVIFNKPIIITHSCQFTELVNDQSNRIYR